MANFEFTRPGGLWQELAGVAAEDLASLDRKTVKAPNFTEGGSYAPSGPITIGGAGVHFTGPIVSDGGAEFHGNVNFIGANFGDLAIFQGDISIGGLTYAKGAAFDGAVSTTGQLSVGAAAHLASNLTVEASALFRDQLTVEDGIRVFVSGAFYGEYQFFNSVTIGNGFGTEAILTTAMRTTELGRVVRTPTVATKETETYSPARTDWVNIPGGLLSAPNRVQTISDSACLDGDEIGFTNNSASYPILVANPAGSGFPIPATHWGKFKRFNGSWTMIQMGSFFRHSVDD